MEKKITQFKYKTGNRMWNTRLIRSKLYYTTTYIIYIYNKKIRSPWPGEYRSSRQSRLEKGRQPDEPHLSSFPRQTDKSWFSQTFSKKFDRFYFQLRNLS